MYRYVVWDWNGTLLDDAWLSVEVINRMLARRGLPLASPARYARIFGFPLEDYCRRLGFDLEREPFAQLSDEFSSEYEARRLECQLRGGAEAVLRAVAGRGAIQAVLSAYEQQALRDLVVHFGLAGHFHDVVGVDNVHGSGKVALGRRWIGAIGWPPGQVLLVGDTLHDRDVAAAMGVDCALIPSGHQERSRLEGQGVTVIEDLPHLLDLLAEGRHAREI